MSSAPRGMSRTQSSKVIVFVGQDTSALSFHLRAFIVLTLIVIMLPYLFKIFRITFWFTHPCWPLHPIGSMEMPSWGLKRSSEGQGQEQGARVKVAKVVAGGGSDKDIVRQLVEILAVLSLVNAAELRELCSVVYMTFLIPAAATICVEMKNMGKAYHERAKQVGEIEDEEAKQKAVEEQGPPFLHMWLALLQGLAKAPDEQKLDENGKGIVDKYWQDVVLKEGLHNLAEQVRCCKLKEVKKKKKKVEYMRLTFAIDAKYNELEQVVKKGIIKQGGEQKRGPAPKGPLEREASRLLEKLKKT